MASCTGTDAPLLVGCSCHRHGRLAGNAPCVTAPSRVMRTTITPSATAPLTIGQGRDLAIAPDGSRLVYVGANGTQLLVRVLDQLVPTALPGLGAPLQPIFSPDGQWIAFFDGNTALKKVAATGGPAVRLAPPMARPAARAGARTTRSSSQPGARACCESGRPVASPRSSQRLTRRKGSWITGGRRCCPAGKRCSSQSV